MYRVRGNTRMTEVLGWDPDFHVGLVLRSKFLARPAPDAAGF